MNMKKVIFALAAIALLLHMAASAGWSAGRLKNGAPGWYVGTCYADDCYLAIRPIHGGVEIMTADETIRIAPPHVYHLLGGWK